MKNIILIGGAPTTGKSTIAEQLSREFGIPWISTDQIRTMIKTLVDEGTWPDLFRKNSEQDTPMENVDQEIKGKGIIWRGVLAFIDRYHPWNGCIIEGTAILPHLVARDLSNKEGVSAIFLVHDSDEKIKELVFDRSKLPFIKTKTESQQESKVQEIKILNDRIQADASKYGFTTIMAQTEKTLGDVTKALKS